MISFSGAVTSLEDYAWPLGMTEVVVHDIAIKSLKGIPRGLHSLSLSRCSITTLEGIPQDLGRLVLAELLQPVDLTPVLTAAYCGTLQGFYYHPPIHPQSENDCHELQRAMDVPLRNRPARVVLIVLSSSSVPRVGTRAAVRRLNRADLVREMAGMLDEVYEVVVEEWESEDEEGEE